MQNLVSLASPAAQQRCALKRSWWVFTDDGAQSKTAAEMFRDTHATSGVLQSANHDQQHEASLAVANLCLVLN